MTEDTESKSVYEYVTYDSDTEASFAKEMEITPGVKLFVKLPSWFVIPTPLGT